MKGTIAICLKEIIEKNFGKEKFAEILEKSEVGNVLLLATMDIRDDVMMELISTTLEVLNLTQEELFNLFGDYWINDYASRIYSAYFSLSSNAKEFLMNMDLVHRLVTEVTQNASPPQFFYEVIDDNKILMKYNSTRNLSALIPGLVKGVAKYYNERIFINKIDRNTFEITFSG